MKKILLIGINTRSMLNSALKLDCEVFSASYFSTADTPIIENQKVMLKEEAGKDCGVFEDEFNSHELIELSKDFIDEVDYIIPVSGVTHRDFKKKHQKKILGNKNIESIEDKYRFYKKIKDEFNTPQTFNISDIYEAKEIMKNNPEKEYIIKPIKGSGGYDVKLIDTDTDFQLNDGEYIMQEYIQGISLSSSVLANKNTSQTIVNSRLLSEHDFKNNHNYKYVGNIVPLTEKSILKPFKYINTLNRKMKTISQKLVEKFKVIGSNGVDFILNEDGLYVIELNPRIQGTFECVEKSLGVNMLESHIMACQNELISVPEPSNYCFKKIIYSPATVKYEQIDLKNIYDIPHPSSITQKGEPLLTIIDKDHDFDRLYKKVEKASFKVNKIARKDQPDA